MQQSPNNSYQAITLLEEYFFPSESNDKQSKQKEEHSQS